MTFLALVILSFERLRWDEQLALSAVVVAFAALAWAFAYTAAEGALRPQRVAFRRAADVLVVVALYFVGRIWL